MALSANKISALTHATIPYGGSELAVLVQSDTTKNTTLSSVMNYLTGGVYNPRGSTPGIQPIASPLKNNHFCYTQTIAGSLSATCSLIVGNNQSSITTHGTYASVAGGDSNVASGDCSVIGGGCSNTASGSGSFIGGGGTNEAAGISSFIGGGAINCARAAFQQLLEGTLTKLVMLIPL